MVIAITVTALNFALAFKFKLLRRGMLLISSGLLIGIMVHSIVELLESLNLMSFDFLVMLMPVLVSVGSLLIITGGVFVARDAIYPLDTIMRDMRGFSSPELPFHITPEAAKLNNEIGALARGLQGLVENLQRTTVSKTHFETIITTANDAFISIDEEGAILEWNPAAQRIFGWSRQEAIGKPMAQTIIPLQYREAHLKWLSRFIGTGEGPVI
ncbi:MAG: PAS domain S-box protein, partial [Nitrospirota bacterium]